MNEARPGPRPATFGAAIQDMALSPEEEELLEKKKALAADGGFSSVEDYEAELKRREEEAEKSPLATKAADPGAADEVPRWVAIPKNFRFPIGRPVGFMRFPSEWTTRSEKGLLAADDDPNPEFRGRRFRQAIMWSLSINDEKFARQDARGDNLALVGEMAKRQIRAIDGNAVDWSTGSLNRETAVSMGTGQSAAVGRENHVPTFWEEIGPGCRNLVIAHWHKTHNLGVKDEAVFFLHCYVVRNVAVG